MSRADPGEVLAALGDPTRQQIVTRLASGQARTATELARDLPITRQGVAKHLATLRDAHVVHREEVGRESRYRLDRDAIAAARSWIADIEATWDARLDRLAGLAERDD